MSSSPSTPWWREMTRYHWFVFFVAAVGWLADCMDQQLFVLTRDDALSELLGKPASDPAVRSAGGTATAIFLMGWAIGGLIFGVMGDRIGRVRTMLITIVIYSIFTGISIFATGFWDYSLYRFLTGLGVGGEFAVGVALVAEVMPGRARPYTLGMLQAFSAIGNCTAALIYIGLGMLEMNGSIKGLMFLGMPLTGWRMAFLFGTIPAAIALLVRRKLKEPELWVGAKDQKRGSYAELFSDPRWRYHAFIGLGIGFAAVVGLWGIGFFGVQLAKNVIKENLSAEGLAGNELNGRVQIWGGLYSFFLNLGAALGMMCAGYLAQRVSRRGAFFFCLLAAMIATAATFWTFNSTSMVFWQTPIMGFCLLSLFAVLAIYFPELFPTRLRSTGTSFCYNVGRFVAALGPYMFGFLVSHVFSKDHGYSNIEGFRYAGVVMCSIFLIGMAVLPFAPETKGKPLPE